MAFAWVVWAGEKLLAGAEYVGEGIAEFLGITSSKYEYELWEHQKMEEEKRRKDAEEGVNLAELEEATQPPSQPSSSSQEPSI